MASSTSDWYPLPAFPDVPVLLASARLAPSSYTIHVTDLANIWVESLDRKAILLRSLQEDTSIDLSVGDADQWAAFLSKLKAAFDPTSPDHHLCSLSLSASPASLSRDGLTLIVTCVLPEPLRPLQWPVYLAKCPLTSLTTELVLPLVQAHDTMAQDVQDLVHRLKEKDAVITKLVDKLEAMSTGLEHVFNSLPGKRKATRAAAEDKVKGLAPFNQDDWRLRRDISRELPQDVSSLIQGAFGRAGLSCDAKMGIDASSRLSDWWEKLGPDPRSAMKPQATGSPMRSHEVISPNTTSNKEGDDGEFQVQATPPHLQHTRRKLHPAKFSKDTSGDDNDDDSPTEIPDSHPVVALEKPRAQVGAIGVRKPNTQVNPVSGLSPTNLADDDETASESDHDSIREGSSKPSNSGLGFANRPQSSPVEPTVSSPPSFQRQDGDGDDGDETASNSGSDSDKPSGPQSPQRLAISQQRKGGLGRIGGKPSIANAPSENQYETASGTGTNTTRSPAKPAGSKIGAIGNRAGADVKRLPSQAVAEPQEVENEEQRASRKRAELAKELEKKAVAPAKKKRRF